MMDDEPRGVWRLRRASEALILAMACLAPWAFGSVEAWAEFVLELGIAGVTILGAIADGRSDRSRRLLCVPSLALAGLVLLAVVQAIPLPAGILRRIDPTTAALRAGLMPGTPERVIGDPAPPVAPPPATLSQDREATLQMAARLAAAWLLFQGVLGLGGGPASFRRFALAIAGNATLLSLFALVQALTWNGKIYWLRPSPLAGGWSGGGPFVSHSHLAAYLNIGLGLALGFLFSGGRGGVVRGGGSRLWAAYAAAILVVGITASHSRGGFLAMILAAAVLSALLRPGSLRLGAGLAALTVMVALFLYALGGSSSYRQRLSTILDRDDPGYTGRLELWGTVLRAWRDHPIWGTGLGSFPAATAPYFRRDHGSFFSRAENEYVDLLVEGGILGLGLALTAAVGIARLGRRASAAAPSPRDRALVLGAMFGGLTLLIHSVSDFGLHIPGVAVPAVILGAHLCRLGLGAQGRLRGGGPASPGDLPSSLAGAAAATLGLAILVHGCALARAEAGLAGSDVPWPGTEMPTAGLGDVPGPELERRRAALGGALRYRPDWAEGHLRQGETLLNLYRRTTAAWIGQTVGDPEEASRLAHPLWLLRVIHAAEGGPARPAGGLLEHEPIRLYLVPAARSFLEARRCCPVSALAHAELAGLHYLLEGGDPAAVYGGRALGLAGGDESIVELIVQVALAIGDLDLAARCWRKSLEVREAGWPRVAAAAAAALPPDRILEGVVSRGRHALWFAERLYAAPGDRAVRERFLRAAIARLPGDRDLAEAERLRFEAQAWAGLGDPGRARVRMEAALALEPRRGAWRAELIGWLIAWGEVEAAHDQALVGLHFSPDDPLARRALEQATEALARGAAAARPRPPGIP
jgi:O-antigen ligase